jgi:hypothetical protein
MWFRRKRKNRRFERAHILDVKVQSRQLRAMRVGLAVTVLARVLGAVAVVFVLWRGGDWFLEEFVFRNPAFAIQAIDIETDGILPKAQLRSCAGVKVGDNLLAVDLNRVQRDLEYLPWIRNAAVERVRPHTLKIRVLEREPIAQTSFFESTGADGQVRTLIFYFDAEGYAMLPLEVHRLDAAAFGFDALPMLTGVAGVDLRPGHQVEDPQIQAGLRLIAEFGRSPMFGLVDVSTVDLSVPQLLQVSTAQGAAITFSAENPDLQLRRWRLVHDYAARNAKAVASLDLSVSNNVPARWLEASSVPQVRPKPPKPSPYRKKHV